jgi:uncharacterized protein YjbJ (UPF0337 family)
VKLQMLIVPVLAAVAFASGCASWNAHDGNDYQCGYAVASERHYTALAYRQHTSNCGANYAAAAGATKSSGKESAMNWNMIESDWKQFGARVKEKWGRLTDENLALIAGRRDYLSAQIQRSYGISKDQTERQLKLFEEVHKDSQPKRPA